MLFNPIRVMKAFHVWGIDFMRPFPPIFGFVFILVIVYYVSKWIMVVPCRQNDSNVKFLKKNILTLFGTPRVIISDGGTHFCNRLFEALMRKRGIIHKVPTPCHSQSSGQIEVSHRKIKHILEKTVIQVTRIRLYGYSKHFRLFLQLLRHRLVCPHIGLSWQSMLFSFGVGA